MAIIQTATLVVVLLNLIMEIANAVSYHKRIDKLEKRVAELEAMVGSTH